MKRMLEEDFITKSKELFGKDTIGYDLVNFVNAKVPVQLICRKHKEVFTVAPRTHLKGTCCKYCNSRYLDTDIFIEKAKSVHGDLYDYSKVEYVNNKTKVKITCNIHGEFSQQTNEHLSGGGCPICGTARAADSKRKQIGNFIKDANTVHNNKYTYDKVEYVNNKTKVTITCPVHGDFEQVPNTHLSGCGCSECVEFRGGFKSYLPGTLYYIKVTIENDIAYKIGITNRTIEERFCKDIGKIQIVKTWDFPNGKDARKEEKKILDKFAVYKWTGPALLVDGNTELFDRDVLELDKGDIT